METLTNLDPRGCLSKALPDEPFFVLLARDPSAPAAIVRWADLRAARAVEEEGRQDAQQLTEAFDIAEAMQAWRKANDGRWREQRPPVTVDVLAGVLRAMTDNLVGPVDPDDGSDAANGKYATRMLALIDVAAQFLLDETLAPHELSAGVHLLTRQLAERIVLRRRLMMATAHA